jgi:hypothetical protein
MHSNPIGDPTLEDRDTVVLDLLLIDHDGVWTIDELQHLVGDPIGVEDSIARLSALRLVHRLQDCVFATRAAAHMHKLAG